MNISPARKSAFEILNKIEKENAYTSILLPLYAEQLDLKDRGLCHEIVLGVLRKKLYLDEIIKKLTKKNRNKFDVEVLNALRIGIYQLYFLDRVPVYSSVNESVNLVKIAKKRSASGLVNAVLRQVAKKKIELEYTNDLKRISIETSHPVWLIEKWIKQFGVKTAEKIAEANNATPKMTFRMTAKFYSKDIETRKLIIKSFDENVSKSVFIEDSFKVKKISEELRELVRKGYIYFQDEGSQIVASCVDLKYGECFFDVCASPGSKTTYVARKKEDVNIVAGDLYSQRVRKLKENCLMQGIEIAGIVQYDATKNLPFADESFAVVLVDAPCSGTGTIRNNPEIRYNLCEKDLSELTSKQLAILNQASKRVKRGGRLIYSTCSLETEENEEVIKKFLDENSTFENIELNLDKRFMTNEGFARIFPHKEGTDGFFIAGLKRII